MLKIRVRPEIGALALIATAVLTLSAGCSRDPEVLKRRYFDSGNKYFEQKNYAEAIIQYRNAVTQDARFGEARLKLGEAYEATGDAGNALREYVRAADLMPDNTDAQLRAGKWLVTAGRYEEAKTRATAVLAKEPKNVNGLIVLGNAIAGLKDLDNAIVQLQQAVDAEPRLLFGYVNLSVLELRKGDRAAAESALKRAVDVDPKSIQAHLTLANFYWSGAQRDEAERELQAAFALDPKSADVNRVLAVFHFTGKQPASAEPYFKTYAEVSGKVAGKLGLAEFYLQQQRTQEAVAILQRLVDDAEGFAPATLRLAALDFGDGRQADAYKKVDAVLARDRSNEEALELKTRFLLKEKNYDEALKITTAIVKADPTAKRSHFLRGMALAGTGSIDESMAAYRRVLELDPSAAEPAIELANLSLVRGDAKAAADLLRPVAKRPGAPGTAHFLLGQAELLLGNVKAAESELVPTAASNPSSVEIQTWLGRLYAAKGDMAGARRVFSQVLEHDPNSVAALNGLVTLDVVNKDPKSAAAKLEPRLAAHPDDRDLLYLAGSAYLTLGDSTRAEPLFKHLLELDPNNINAYGRLGSIYFMDHRLPEAKSTFEELSRRQKEPVAAGTMLAVILDMLGQRDEARKQYEKVLSFAPDAPVAANNLAWKYAEANENLDTALKLAQTAKSKLPNNPQFTDTLGWVYYKKGLTPLAVSTLQQAVHQNPADATFHYHLGAAFVKNGDRAEGQRSLETALKLNTAFNGADDARQLLESLKGSPSSKSSQ